MEQKKRHQRNAMNDPTPVFAGLKVIDCASYIAAPAAATVLADFGGSTPGASLTDW